MSEDIPPKPSREKIADVINTQRGILSPQDTVQSVSDQMTIQGANVVPISEGGILVGLADQPNPGLGASSHGHDPKTTRIAETMNRDLIFCHEEDDCRDALHKMESRGLSHLSVVDHEMRMIAVVAREDLTARLARAAIASPGVDPVASPIVAAPSTSSSPVAVKKSNLPIV